MNDNPLVNDILREFDEIAVTRGNFERQWEEVAQRVLPHYSTSFYSQGNMSPGVKRGFEMYDITANSALWKFAAAMESMLTPSNGKWHRLRCSNPDLHKIKSVAEWFDAVNDLMFHYRYAPHSNFQSQQHDGYVSVGAFGTSCLYIDQLDRKYGKGIRYRNVNLGEVFFAANHQGIVDKMFRRFKMTLRQIEQQFGIDQLPDTLIEVLKVKPETQHQLIHAVLPNSNYEPGRLDSKGKKYSSCYILKEQGILLAEGGYREFPYAIARYLTAPGELFGRSPAMNVLPAIKVLNEQKRTLLKQGHRAVDPVLLAHDDGILSGVNMAPGAVNFGGVSADGRPLVHALPVGNVAIGKELLDDERLAINDAFLVTLFQILVETPQMTATEVLERAREKGALLSPTMGRFQSESIGPMIVREFDLLAEQNLLPPPPPVLIQARGEWKVEFDSPLNRAMRAEEASGIMRSVQFAAEIAANMQDPSMLDMFDFDKIIPAVADINGAPFKYMRSPEDVQQRRDQRNQEKQAAMMTQALPGVAALTKSLAPTNQQGAK